MNLQLFADQADRREAPTGKRRSEARRRGQVAQSREISMAFGLVASFLVLRSMGGRLMDHLELWMVFFLKELARPSMSPLRFQGWMASIGRDLVDVLLPFLLVPLLASVATTFFQRGLLFRLEALSPSLDKLNPLNGLKRFFSLNALVELGKGFLKMGLLGYLLYSTMVGLIPSFASIFGLGLSQGILLLGDALNAFLWKAILLIFALAVGDYFYQRYQYEQGLKMTKEEVKEEARQADMSPELRGQIRRKLRQAMRRRMMSMVPQADVVITNPTHLAVALRYDPAEADAPICVAKGAGFVAERIRDIARANGVEIVEDKPLAQALFRQTEVGEPVPPQFYQAVAEILAYVYRRSAKRSFI